MEAVEGADEVRSLPAEPVVSLVASNRVLRPDPCGSKEFLKVKEMLMLFKLVANSPRFQRLKDSCGSSGSEWEDWNL